MGDTLSQERKWTLHADARPLIVVEDDPFTRIIEIVLDPGVEPARVANSL